MLKKNTTKCPNDKKLLHFEVMSGMRIARMDSETKVLSLSAKCPQCGEYFKVKAE